MKCFIDNYKYLLYILIKIFINMINIFFGLDKEKPSYIISLYNKYNCKFFPTFQNRILRSF